MQCSPPEKVIRSDENVPLNIPSDKELGRIYNKNVADYEKKNQQLKRKQPDAGTVYLANEKAKREQILLQQDLLGIKNRIRNI